MIITAFVKPSRTAAKFIKTFKREKLPISAIFIETGANKAVVISDHTQGKIKKNIATIERNGLADLWKKVLDYLQIALSSIYRRLNLAPPKWIPPWITNPEWYTIEYYRQFYEKVFPVSNFNSADAIQAIHSVAPDLVILCGVTRIIKQNIIEIPRIGILNAHPGILPKYRGVEPIPYALLNGDPLFVTVHFIDSGVDSGSILNQCNIEIKRGDTLEDLWKRSEDVAAQLMTNVVQSLIAGTANPVPQDSSLAKQNYTMTKENRIRVKKILKMRH
jgi:folate-dependent phosphoribosylglycinamide formyltransferase PurN